MSWSIRHALFVIVSALVLVTGAAWVGVTDEMVDDGSTVSEAPTTSDGRLQAAGSTTTSPRGWEGDVGLFRVDPATLAPVPGSRPITSGGWISGSMSENGEWLVLNVWIDTDPDTDVVRVVEVATGRVVTDVEGPLLHELRVGDDRAVYNHFDNGACGGKVGRLPPGGTSFVTVFERFPDRFCSWGPMALLDGDHIGWLGMLSGDSGEQKTALLVGDMSDGSALLIEVSSVSLGSVGEQDMGDWVVTATVVPAVVWDATRNRALVVHADQPQVSIVDVDTGEVSEHVWTEQTSFLDGVWAWLVPAANAKGPDSGVTRSALLGSSGDVLYVATQQSEVVVAEDGQWSVESMPQGVEVIDTESWKMLARFDIPASQVSLSPDGSYLVATGVAVSDTLSTTAYHPQGAFIVRTDTLKLVGHVDPPSEWFPDIQYSADSKYMYLGSSGGGPIQIVELSTAKTLDIVAGPQQLTVFGEAAMLSTTIQR